MLKIAKDKLKIKINNNKVSNKSYQKELTNNNNIAYNKNKVYNKIDNH